MHELALHGQCPADADAPRERVAVLPSKSPRAALAFVRQPRQTQGGGGAQFPAHHYLASEAHSPFAVEKLGSEIEIVPAAAGTLAFIDR